MIKVYNSLILLVLFINTTYSQKLVPPIQNFSPTDYSAASQNWDVAIDEKGVIYAANNQGLLVYDGLSWELYPLEGQSIIRSVLPYKGRIYTGSYQEFGYWQKEPDGRLAYTSLTPLMEEFDLKSDEFWEIMAFKDAIYFRSFGAIFKYENNSISKVNDGVSTALGIFNDQLLYSPSLQGLVYLEHGKTKALQGDLSQLEGVNIIDMEARGDSLFIAGKEDLFVYANNTIKRIGNSSLKELLPKYELNQILSVSSNEIILGTIKNGIIQYDIARDTYKIYNRGAGLQNNTVLGLAYSRGRLWLALDKGVDMVELDAPIHFYTDNTGELGAVYDVQIFKDAYYLASNTGIYTFRDGRLTLIENAGDHAWNLEVIGNELFANHNTGFFRIDNNDFNPLDTRTGSFTVKNISQAKDKLLVGNYTGISIYDQANETNRELEGINFPVKELIFENDHSFWAAHPYEGIYKIGHENFEGLSIKKVRSLGGKENFNPHIYMINNQVVTYVDENWYKYNPFKDDFELFQEFKEYAGSRLIYKDSEYYVFASANSGELLLTDLKEKNIPIAPRQLNHRLVKSNENIIRKNDSILLVTLNDGFASINLKNLIADFQDQWISIPFIKEFSDEKQRYSLEGSPEISFQNSRNITLKAGMPSSEAIKLNYTLKGEEQLEGTVESGVVNFRNLEYGDYELQLNAVGAGATESRSQNYNFRILPPWYLSLPMKLAYILSLIVVLLMIYWFNKKKLKKHQLQLEAKFEKEHQDRLNRIEREKLINEIDLKRKELANTTMMAAKKNEVLMEIQGELNKDKSKFSNQFRLKHIMTKINQAVKNKDEWRVFETNFNEVHEDFFKDLLQQYPKLTSKDLKLCSYLKMNLSSKEIAPLMGISVRGVEVHRYRLRKKMELDGDVNLTKFLIKNF